MLASVAISRAAVEFTGVLATSERTLLALTDTATGHTAWLGVGKPFGDYMLSNFDAKTDTVTLTKDGVATQVHLKGDAKVAAARLELAGTIKVGKGEKVDVI